MAYDLVCRGSLRMHSNLQQPCISAALSLGRRSGFGATRTNHQGRLSACAVVDLAAQDILASIGAHRRRVFKKRVLVPPRQFLGLTGRRPWRHLCAVPTLFCARRLRRQASPGSLMSPTSGEGRSTWPPPWASDDRLPRRPLRPWWSEPSMGRNESARIQAQPVRCFD